MPSDPPVGGVGRLPEQRQEVDRRQPARHRPRHRHSDDGLRTTEYPPLNRHHVQRFEAILRRQPGTAIQRTRLPNVHQLHGTGPRQALQSPRPPAAEPAATVEKNREPPCAHDPWLNEESDRCIRFPSAPLTRAEPQTLPPPSTHQPADLLTNPHFSPTSCCDRVDARQCGVSPGSVA